MFYCFGGCSQEAVVQALKDRGLWSNRYRYQAMHDQTGGLTLAEFAKNKRLDPFFLAKLGVFEAHGQGVPYLVFTYRDHEAQEIKEAVRFRFSMAERPKSRKGGKPTLYGLWRLPEFRPGGELILMEGESDSLTAWSYDLPAVGIPGKTLLKTIAPAHFTDFHTVYVWQEPDAPGLPGQVAARLPGIAVKAMVPPEGVKDISEAHCSGMDVIALLDGLKAEALTVAPAPPDGEDVHPDGEAARKNQKRQTTQAELLLDLAADAELFHTPAHECYARILVNDHKEVWPVRSGGFRRWLLRKFYEAEGKPPQSEALQSVVGVLEARAQFDGSERPVWVRVAGHERNIYLDLGNSAWKALEITPHAWQVVAEPPVFFRRSGSMAALPYPERGGSVAELRPFLNVGSDSDFILVVAWILAAMRPCGPYPITVLNGEQGAAKSTTGRIMGSLTDPNISPLRSPPREERDLAIYAHNSWTLGFDNLSGLPNWLSDAFCRLSTGGGVFNRQLYTDRDENILDAMRPIILNGIDSLTERPDLADRALIFNLKQIPDESRQSEKQFWAKFYQAQPRILGALLDAVCMALRNQDNVKLAALPRLADFAIWVTAAEPALPWPPGSFMAAYTGNRQEAVELSLEADVVAVALRAHMADKELWSGSPSELFEVLNKHVGDDVQKSRAWPKAPNKLSNRLKRAATFLRAIGIDVEVGGWSNDGKRMVSIRRVPARGQSTEGTVETVKSKEPCALSPHDTPHGTEVSHGTEKTSHDSEKEPWGGRDNNHDGFPDTHDTHDTLLSPEDLREIVV